MKSGISEKDIVEAAEKARKKNEDLHKVDKFKMKIGGDEDEMG
jgi:hypothetical protein